MTIADALAETTVGGLDLSRHVSVTPDTSVAATVAAMRDRALASACVVDDGRIVGMFTQRDILQRVIGRNRSWDGPISGEMTTVLKTVSHDASVADALEEMARWWVRNMIVLDDDGGFVGTLSYYTVVRYWTALLTQQLEGPLADDVVREGLSFVDFTGINLRPVVTVGTDDPVEVAIHNLRNRGLEQVMVTDERGHLVGVVTEFDLQQQVGCDPIDLTTTPTSAVMDTAPPSLPVRSSIAEAIDTLGTYETSNITLTRETGQPAGVASFRQIAAFVEASLEATDN
ncbi:MAG: CBS domain-containing protein [Actinomycetota bacterium]